jgi:hypothetical protein
VTSQGMRRAGRLARACLSRADVENAARAERDTRMRFKSCSRRAVLGNAARASCTSLGMRSPLPVPIGGAIAHFMQGQPRRAYGCSTTGSLRDGQA